ncbi:hypothetical protein BGX28_009310 [Mortierella sp. GBA30]|nr:hypothetical protein BGX28_009310 [Mortierella sp. GBA30]
MRQPEFGEAEETGVSCPTIDIGNFPSCSFTVDYSDRNKECLQEELLRIKIRIRALDDDSNSCNITSKASK